MNRAALPGVRLNLRPWALASLLALSACSAPEAPGSGDVDAGGTGGSDAGDAGGGLTGEVQLGVPGGPDGLDFSPLEDGAVLNLETFGQGGTHVLLGVRCIGFGSRAFVELRAKNLALGSELIAPAPARPQLLFCEGQVCDLVPITMMMGGIAPSDAERDGLAIELTANVHNAAGVSAKDSRRALLSTQDL
ncbi:MAG TPA: hypothetical protein VER04_17970 [Polyangiaceae bacterium]|nr:hypothetical protein [Polyangiaceae bacterium]